MSSAFLRLMVVTDVPLYMTVTVSGPRVRTPKGQSDFHIGDALSE